MADGLDAWGSAQPVQGKRMRHELPQPDIGLGSGAGEDRMRPPRRSSRDPISPGWTDPPEGVDRATWSMKAEPTHHPRTTLDVIRQKATRKRGLIILSAARPSGKQSSGIFDGVVPIATRGVHSIRTFNDLRDLWG